MKKNKETPQKIKKPKKPPRYASGKKPAPFGHNRKQKGTKNYQGNGHDDYLNSLTDEQYESDVLGQSG